jgi:hypothetical protein
MLTRGSFNLLSDTVKARASTSKSQSYRTNAHSNRRPHGVTQARNKIALLAMKQLAESSTPERRAARERLDGGRDGYLEADCDFVANVRTEGRYPTALRICEGPLQI